MKNLKKFAALGIAAVMSMSMLVGCGSKAPENANTEATTETAEGSSETSGASVETKHHKIGVGLYQDNGQGPKSVHAYLDGISDIVDVDFEYITMSTFDEATNLTQIQNLIAAGCEGIILTTDMGTTSILEECASAGVYVAGYLNDFNTSYVTANEEVFGNEYFLGTIADGQIDRSGFADAVADEIIAGGYKNIGILTFPTWAYPEHANIAARFVERMDEYNASASADEQITYTDITELQFSPLPDTYFSENPNLDALFSICAGSSFVYPTMVAAGVENDIKLYTSGFEATADVENFGKDGNHCFQTVCCSATEGIVYPLVLLVDKLNGASFSDMPEGAQRAELLSYTLTSDEKMDRMKTTLTFTADYKDAAITGEDILSLCASYNADATYKNLTDTVFNIGF